MHLWIISVCVKKYQHGPKLCFAVGADIGVSDFPLLTHHFDYADDPRPAGGFGKVLQNQTQNDHGENVRG